MKKLSASAFQAARKFILDQARPLERARFAHHFEGGPAAAVSDALAAFQNPDGGFGRALEPDLRAPESSGLGVMTALDLLRELDAPAQHPQVRGAIAWLVERYDPAIPGWACVPATVEQHPHANHWNAALHAPGGGWPHLSIPGARLLMHLQHWRDLAPEPLVAELRGALLAHVMTQKDDVGGDGLHYLSGLDDTAAQAHTRALARATVSRDPTKWREYVSKPLKLAPRADSPLAETLASEIQTNLDWELGEQSPDGAWSPNWDWQGKYADAWPSARQEWRGILTVERLTSLDSFRRLS